jgi:hypothetical protein
MTTHSRRVRLIETATALLAPVALAALLAGAVRAGEPPTASSPEALRAEVEALKAAKVAWREIAWKSCLLEGLRESREKKKPVLLWVFIDRPADDGRC